MTRYDKTRQNTIHGKQNRGIPYKEAIMCNFRMAGTANVLCILPSETGVSGEEYNSFTRVRIKAPHTQCCRAAKTFVAGPRASQQHSWPAVACTDEERL